ncbi:hypothetical protein B296_00007656 [Ensete ventricosum]|uniref:Uncharacterized protein n=1 Tax=Ensete ventricosum TaxID=4639 RepID=A0A426YF94_ENSVE|nr:hypothetical protein B296_00007656 [Ensete ventricosum]
MEVGRDPHGILRVRGEPVVRGLAIMTWRSLHTFPSFGRGVLDNCDRLGRSLPFAAPCGDPTLIRSGFLEDDGASVLAWKAEVNRT